MERAAKEELLLPLLLPRNTARIGHTVAAEDLAKLSFVATRLSKTVSTHLICVSTTSALLIGAVVLLLVSSGS
jgi:hypothetical protein